MVTRIQRLRHQNRLHNQATPRRRTGTHVSEMDGIRRLALSSGRRPSHVRRRRPIYVVKRPLTAFLPRSAQRRALCSGRKLARVKQPSGMGTDVEMMSGGRTTSGMHGAGAEVPLRGTPSRLGTNEPPAAPVHQSHRPSPYLPIRLPVL